MKQAILKKDGYHQWIAEYNEQTFLIWHSYLWDENYKWHYYYTVYRLSDCEGYFSELAGNRPMTVELATRLCKKCIAKIK